MDKKKSQHYNFSHEAMPVLFHSNPDNFFKYIEKDGVKFLKFYWQHLETNLRVEILSSSAGLSYTTKMINNKIKVVFITLPEPKAIGEAYNLLMVRFPQKLSLFKVGFTRVLSLEYEGEADDGTKLTGVYELTPRARNVRVKDGPAADSDAFYSMALDILKIKIGGSDEA